MISTVARPLLGALSAAQVLGGQTPQPVRRWLGLSPAPGQLSKTHLRRLQATPDAGALAEPVGSAGPTSSASAATVAGGPAAAPATIDSEDDVPLGTADLERYMQQHGIHGSIVQPLNGARPPPRCCEVKSLVFLIDSHPVVLVLPIAARVDERRLAALLHTGRNRIRLAPVGSLVQLCGYTVGNVPPFGHRRRLPVILESSVTTYDSCYAGGGSDDAEIFLAVQELVRASGATVAEFCVPGGAVFVAAGEDRRPGEAAGGQATSTSAAEQQQQLVATAAAAGLPLPWRPGHVDVELQGVIANKRKIARLLLFANLVPLDALARAQPAFGSASSGSDAAVAPKPGTTALLRRLWRHPESQAPCEVQLIMGRTLERRLGSEAAAQLLRSIRPGQCVRLTGRVQPHIQKASSSSDDVRTAVCDVVVHSIELIDAPTMPAVDGFPPLSGTASSIAGSLAAATSTSGSAQSQAAATAATATAAAGCYQLPPSVRDRVYLVDSWEGLQQLEAALFVCNCSSDSSSGSTGSSSGSTGSSSSGGAGASSTSDPSNAHRSANTVNSSADGTEEAPGGSGAADSSASSASSPKGFGAPSPFRLVVGLDCEWQPYSSRLGEPRTPVSLLQLATPDAVFLLDLLAICGASSAGSEDSVPHDSTASCSDAVSGGSSSSSSVEGSLSYSAALESSDSISAGSSSSSSLPAAYGAGCQHPAQQAQQPAEQQADGRQELSPMQRQLSDLLLRMFGDPGIIKAGFGLSTDLTRLCESYPHLPCFGSEGPVPLRSHVDVLLLARTALGSALPHTRRRVSLTSLSEKVLGRALDKSEQCSDWGSRPLRPQQLAYAAADAHALVALHSELLRRRAGLDSVFWVSHFSGRLTDVAAFHPSLRRGGRSSMQADGSAATAQQDGGARRSSLSWQERRAKQEASAAARGAGSSRGLGQTLSLDVNVPYLIQTYLGRQLPQGGKAAAVRAAAAHTGRSEAGRTPSFPRGCGGLLEWRNAFLLFINLPAPGDQQASGAGRRYPNQFLWLPAGTAGGTAGEAGPAAMPSAAALAAEGSSEVFAAACSSGSPEQPGQQWLGITWWPGRGQTLEHPVIQRLLTAGAAGVAHTAGAAAAAGEGQMVPPLTATAGAEGQQQEVQEQQQPQTEAPPRPQQAAVLLFCRTGSSPYVFCGRLLPAAVGGAAVLPGQPADTAAAAAAAAGAAGTAGAGAAAAMSSGPGAIVWELADAAQLLGSDAFQQLLRAAEPTGRQ